MKLEFHKLLLTFAFKFNLRRYTKGADKKCKTMLELIESRDDLSMLREILNEAPAIKATLDGQDMLIQLYHMLG